VTANAVDLDLDHELDLHVDDHSLRRIDDLGNTEVTVQIDLVDVERRQATINENRRRKSVS
jgi:hypothetical protein